MPNTMCNGDNQWLIGSQSQEKVQPHHYYYYVVVVVVVSCHGPFLPRTWTNSDPHRPNTLSIMCDVPSIAIFCNESHVFLAWLPNFSLTLLLLFLWIQLLLV
jgi:hypothetical protein